MVEKNQLSFIVQGHIIPETDTPFGGTKGVLKQIRNLFPDGQIILSVWTGTNTDGLEFDDLVIQDDPHQQENRINPYNLNRQLLGIKGALPKVNRDYLVKTRTDLFLPDDSFLNLYNHSIKSMKPAYFKAPILITKYSSKKFVKFKPVALHYSDWFHFGTKEDISALWSAPLTQEPEFQLYLKDQGYPLDIKLSPEQYFWVHALKDYLPQSFEHMFSFNQEILEFEKNLIKNDLILWDNDRSGLHINRYTNLSIMFKASLFDETDFNLIKQDKNCLYRLRRLQKKYIRL